VYGIEYGMPRNGYESVSVPQDDHDTAQEYKPDGATWGDCLVAGAERLNEHLDSDTGRFGNSGDIDTDELAREVSRQFDYTMLADKTAKVIVEELP